MALFEILRRGSREPKSLTMPATACVEGLALQEDISNPGKAIPADGTVPGAMFVNRPVVTAIPTPSYAELQAGASMPLENPYQSGYEGSLEDADEVVAEGADYILGTGGDAINGSTALKTKTSFRTGKFCVAQTNQFIEFELVEHLTPEVAGNVRARFRRVTQPVA